MLVNKEADLKNSFDIKSIAKYLVTIESESSLKELSVFLENHDEEVLVLGEGTNVVLPDYFDGVVIKTTLNDLTYMSDDEVAVGSSMNWNSFVRWSLDNNLNGLENLTLIPGSVGAAPIQNIGAYGVEVCDFIKSVRFYDLTNNTIKEFNNITKKEDAVRRCSSEGYECEKIAIEKLKHFVSKDAFNIEGFGKKIVENFWNLNLIKLPQDIFNLDFRKIENLKGWG